MKRPVLMGIAGGALALTLLGGVAGAASRSSAGTVTVAQTTPTPAPQQHGERGKKGHHALARGLVRVTAEQTTLTPKQVREELRAGKTFAQIAQEHGSSSDAVVQAARAKLQARLAQAVQNGKITQERADKALARFDERAPEIMNKVHTPKQQPST